MIKFVQVAKRCLPSDLPKGTIFKVPVDITTGKCVNQPRAKDDSTVLFYGFIKVFSGWHFLGRGLTS